MSSAKSPLPGRVPYAGMWLEGFSLTAVPGGALLAGGQVWHPDGIGSTCRATDAALFWDAATAQWTPLPALPSPRFNHAGVTLPDGRALLVGGRTEQVTELTSTLFWEPSTRSFREGPPLREGRAYPVARVLPDGAVLVLGSETDDDFERGTRTELLRPGATSWEPAGQTVRIFHTGPVCVSGSRVIIAGGRDNGMGFAIIDGVHYAPPLDLSTEVWEGSGKPWRVCASPLLESRDDAQGVTLSDGSVLVVGGWNRGEVLASAELWDPSTERWSPAGSLAVSRSSFTLTALPDGRAAVSGGLAQGPFHPTQQVEIWSPETRSWAPGKPMVHARAGHSVVQLEDGAFLVAGTYRATPEDAPETTWELWRPDA